MNEIELISLPDLKGAKNIEIVKFLDQILSHRVNEKIWDWEFNTLPGTLFTYARDNEKIAGIHSMLPVILKIDSTLISTTKSETGYVDKDYRGTQLYNRLFNFAGEKAVDNGVIMTWGFTPAVKAFRDNLKCIVREDIINLSTIRLNYQPFCNKKTGLQSYPLLIVKHFVHNIYALKNKLTACIHFSNDKEIVEKNEMNNETDLVILYTTINMEHKNLIHLNLDKDYLDWRVNSNPALAYKKIFFYKKNILIGYVIYSITDNILAIADLTYANDTSILNHILKYLLRINDNFISLQYWGNYKCVLNNNIFTALEKIGAKRVLDKHRNLIYKIYSSDLNNDKVNDVNNWYINGLWTEGFNI